MIQYVLLICLLMANGLGAVQLDVPGAYATIQTALDASADGDTVLVAPGTYHEHLLGPQHTIFLFSRYAQSADTLDIVNTVLDGDLSGTVLRVRSTEMDSMVVNGFTLTHGLGSHQDDNYEGGAVHVELDANVALLNCAFVENAGSANWGQPTVLKNHSEPNTVSNSNIHLENITLVDNGLNGIFYRQANCMNVYTNGSVVAKNIHVTATNDGYTGFMILGGWGPVLVDGVVAHDADGFRAFFSSAGDVSLRDILISRCLKSHLQANGHTLTASNLSFEDLLLPGYSGGQIALYGDSCAFIDSLTVTRCRVRGATSSWWFQYNMLILNCQNATNDYTSWIRHLVFTDNVGGDTSAVPGRTTQAQMVGIGGLSLEDGVFLRNTMHNWADPNDINMIFGNGVIGALVSYGTGQGLLDARITRCRFEDNLLLDHDTYMENPWEPIAVNNGRSLAVSSWYSNDYPNTQNLEISDLLFRNNRQPNHVPENRDETGSIGSDFYIENENSAMANMHVHDIIMENIDDGGIFLGSFADNSIIESIILKNVNRMGGNISFYMGNTGEKVIRNISIDGVVEQDNHLSYPFQWSMQYALSFNPGSNASNITIYNCNLTNLLGVGNNIIGMVEYDNVFTYINNPYYQSHYHPQYEYCYSSIALTGIENIEGSNPEFDLVLGPPYLSPTSPCVDAGNPASAYRDPEDPANPGFALWPALGTRRNDMGYTGGPATAVPDTSWVSVSGWQPNVEPKAYSLGAPWPNPFNPVTRIPFTLTRPEIVKLSVHNLLGQEVAVLVNGVHFAGRHEVAFDGAGLASGLYFVILEVAGQQITRTITLLR